MPDIKLDSTDKKILEILQENGRITNAQLANQVGLSPPPMLERVKKLEKLGIIKKYVALLDPSKVNKSTMVIVSLSLARHRIKSLDQVNREILNFPEVLECYHIAGEEDYLKALEKVEQKMKKFRPQFVLISAGFDAHMAEPLAHINLTDKGYEELTRRVKRIAEVYAEGRLVSVLEGGYQLGPLGESVERHARVLLEG